MVKSKKADSKKSKKKSGHSGKSRGKRINKKTSRKTKSVKKSFPKKRRAVIKKSARKKSLSRKTKKPAASKKYVIERVPTYIKNFDKLIEGGFEKNSTNLIVGNSGSGKSIFATNFIVEGMKKGERALYVTFEESKNQFYANMMRFGWNLEEYEKKGLFTFLEYTPIKVQTMLEEGGGAIESIILNKKVTRIVIDSITSFALLFDDELEKREAALSLFNMISGWNCTSLLTFEGEPMQDEKVASKTLEFESDSIILLYYLREKDERHRYLEVWKMRGTKHSKKIYRFHIDKKGIVVYPRPVRGIKPGS